MGAEEDLVEGTEVDHWPELAVFLGDQKNVGVVAQRLRPGDWLQQPLEQQELNLLE